MIRAKILVEGQTEESFVNDLLTPHFSHKEIYLDAIVTGRRGNKGGIRRYESTKRELLSVIKSDASAFCTTMFDYYALPGDWPGVDVAKGLQPNAIPNIIESAIEHDVTAAMGTSWNPKQFIPYIQMHEFEALLFSDIEKLLYAHPESAKGIQLLKGETTAFVSPEHIDNGNMTAPSKRILAHVFRYNKIVSGVLTALEIGLPAMRNKCEHFNAWIVKLENLAT